MGIEHCSLVQNLQKHENGGEHGCSGNSQVLSLEMVCRDAKALGGCVECNKRTAKRMTGLE